MHHFVVTGFTDHDDCGGNFARMVGSVIFVWGPGGDAMMMPAEAGFPIVHAGSGDGCASDSITQRSLCPSVFCLTYTRICNQLPTTTRPVSLSSPLSLSRSRLPSSWGAFSRGSVGRG